MPPEHILEEVVDREHPPWPPTFSCLVEDSFRGHQLSAKQEPRENLLFPGGNMIKGVDVLQALE